MWQDAVKPYVDAGDLVALGVVQEQHPDRTRLYRQWRQLDWPILVDSLNTLGHITVVPVPIAINEAGIVVHDRFKPDELETFMRTEWELPTVPADYNRIPDTSPGETPEVGASSSEWHRYGRQLFNLQPYSMDDAIAALETAASIDPSDATIHFSLGSALRRRYESAVGKPGDDQRAVEHWGLALQANPNHYIYRRRLQQYGPRLDKPYNFYFWVREARADLRERGEEPIALVSEPMGSEIAQPAEADAKDAIAALRNPDSHGRINGDTSGLVQIEPLVTPKSVQPGHRVRMRITYRLNPKSKPWWNNEADSIATWLDLPDGFTVLENALAHPLPDEPETQELRQVEIELAVAESQPEGVVAIPAYALYYVCEDAGGVCYYLRQDFSLSVTVSATAPTLK